MIDMNHKYQTRDGRAVRILATDLHSNHPIAGVVTDYAGNEWPCSWTIEGYVEWGTTKAITDLIPFPTKHEMWAVVYADGDYRIATRDRYLFSTEAFAQGSADSENRFHPSLTHDKYRVALVTWED